MPLKTLRGADRARTDVSGFSDQALQAFATTSATAPYLWYWAESNPLRLPLQGNALPVSYSTMAELV